MHGTHDVFCDNKEGVWGGQAPQMLVWSGALRAANGSGANFLVGPLSLAVFNHKDNILVNLGSQLVAYISLL